MNTQLLSMVVLGAIINILAGDESQDVMKQKYRVESTLPFTRIMFYYGAIICKLEPKRLTQISKEVSQMNPDIQVSDSWVEVIEEIRKNSKDKTSAPHFIWVIGEINDAKKSKRTNFDFEHIAKMGLLSFYHGSIFGFKYPDLVEPLFAADREEDKEIGLETTAILSWDTLVQSCKELLR